MARRTSLPGRPAAPPAGPRAALGPARGPAFRSARRVACHGGAAWLGGGGMRKGRWPVMAGMCKGRPAARGRGAEESGGGGEVGGRRILGEKGEYWERRGGGGGRGRG